MDDDMVATMLRQHADRLTEGRSDTDAAYADVARRARATRIRRMAVTAGLATAAAVTGVLIIAGATGEQATVRTPATAPTPPPTIAPSTVPTTVATPATTTLAATSTIATVPPVPEATYEGIGGSIRVRLDGGTVTLATDPSPSPGYTARVDDNGPDRVRVRFERDDERTEIRVEVEGDRLVPTIDEN